MSAHPLEAYSQQTSVTQAQMPLQTQASVGGASVTLFVKNLDLIVNDDELRNIFETIGEVNFAKVTLDPQTGASRGFGFIRYGTPAACHMAIERLNGKMIHGKPIAVEFSLSETRRHDPSNHQEAAPNSTIFIKQLPARVTEDELQKMMSNYGTVTMTKILRDDNTGMSMGKAFIQFNDVMAANAALDLDNKPYPGTNERISVTFSRTPTGAPSQRSKQMAAYQNGFPYGYAQSSYYNASLPASKPNHAIKSMGKTVGIPGAATSAYKAHQIQQHQQQHADPYMNPSGIGQNYAQANSFGSFFPPGTEGAPTVLFVAGLTINVDDAALYRIFTPYGPVYSVKVIRDKATQISKGYGFVTLSNYDMGMRAIQTLNGLIVDSKPIAVTMSVTQQ